MDRSGEWLTGNEEYQRFIKRLCGFDPRLRQRDPKATSRSPWPPRPGNGKVAVIESSPDGAYRGPIYFHDPAGFKTYLRGTPCEANSCVIILEAMDRDFIGLLGAHFSIPPALFAQHDRVTPPSIDSSLENDSIALPTSTATQEHVILPYAEPICLEGNIHGKNKIVCAETGRLISATRTLGEFSNVYISSRKCSVWRRRRAGDERGWDCVVVTDPPLKNARLAHDPKPIPVMRTLFQGGYLDFVPFADQLRAGKGPPRTSMLEDLCFYIVEHHKLLDPDDPDSILLVCQKIIASHFRKHSEFLQAQIYTIHHRMSHLYKLDIFTTDAIEMQWSDTQALQWRLTDWVIAIESITMQCRMPPRQQPDAAAPVGWADIGADFSYLLMRYRDIRHQAEVLSSSITGLAGISGNRHASVEQTLSRQEARSMKALTFVGLVFIPLGLVASLFGVPNPYGPGGEMFWVYFAVSLPLSLLTFTMYFLFNGEFRTGRWVHSMLMSGYGAVSARMLREKDMSVGLSAIE
ncbi:hypothetical protein B0T24DRAFT_627165 [Lasiosphaeria ovina]|uniref:Uncharacterized protein n=1 Tax=Lasiosphaeria ovina TaxID=92902 RepID=A0AAE0K5Z5_9PEZI|nr:hypothetical protein B0T24DRAFT_627165 [Lasiosphaeria ovina]